jgi:hypothetical protein
MQIQKSGEERSAGDGDKKERSLLDGERSTPPGAALQCIFSTASHKKQSRLGRSHVPLTIIHPPIDVQPQVQVEEGSMEIIQVTGARGRAPSSSG